MSVTSKHPGPSQRYSDGRGMSTPGPVRGVRPAIFYGLATLLIGANILTLVGFLMSPDIARILNHQNEQIFSAYEDRIAQLRLEIDRLHSRQYARTGDINLQLQELAQQQDLLTEQHHYVKALAAKAAELGLAPKPSTDLTTGSLAFPAAPLAGDIEATAQALDTMMAESRSVLADISTAAKGSTTQILAELEALGIRPALIPSDAMGGPFLPAIGLGAANEIEVLDLVDDANAIMTALTRFKLARLAIDEAPVHAPLTGHSRISSSYGNRPDPFGRGAAFHSGIDFPRTTGTLVLSAGAGTVIFAGQRAGYGNLVEIDHGRGLITRYGHLSAFVARVGQQVGAGAPIAKVGSTGRSTGPHLHFEVRRGGTPVDPQKFLDAGKRLQRFISA